MQAENPDATKSSAPAVNGGSSTELELAASLMGEFADATGITRQLTPRRYLWTDAYAVCNFLGLFRRTGDRHYLQLAAELVRQVHHILGRHRPDDPRKGWISGLSEADGERHPTCGGLRIGKCLPERGPNQRFDTQLEWDRDGQYFHYLTRWIHALWRMGAETGDSDYFRWAVELAMAAHRGFCCHDRLGTSRRMVWKMSIDLRRPLVASMGQHDPLDGLVTCLELKSVPPTIDEIDCYEFATAIADMSEMCQQDHWATEDPLGIGGLLDNLVRLTLIERLQYVDRNKLIKQVCIHLSASLADLDGRALLSRRAEHRLAFRELGLSIGMRGLDRVRNDVELMGEFAGSADRLLRYTSLSEQIIAFWSQSRNRDSKSWTDHCDINTVMLATSLEPEGYFFSPSHSGVRTEPKPQTQIQ
jgi:hypothetical protein